MAISLLLGEIVMVKLPLCFPRLQRGDIDSITHLRRLRNEVAVICAWSELMVEWRRRRRLGDKVLMLASDPALATSIARDTLRPQDGGLGRAQELPGIRTHHHRGRMRKALRRGFAGVLMEMRVICGNARWRR